jgi:hypothetical protein
MKPSETYAKMLEAEGLLVQTDSGGTLHFKYEGGNYELLTYADDLQYVGIRTTYQLLAGVRRSHAAAEANDVTRRAKVAKVYLLPKRAVTIAAELFINEPEQLDAVLYRLIRLVQGVSSDYFSRLAKHAPVSA